jgi:hypothetical protein
MFYYAYYPYFYACALYLDHGREDYDNATMYARRISADGVGALNRGTGHICSALCYVDGSTYF